MTVYEIRFEDGSTVHIDDVDPDHASNRAADLHDKTVVAWRHDRRPQIRVGIGDD